MHNSITGKGKSPNIQVNASYCSIQAPWKAYTQEGYAGKANASKHHRACSEMLVAET